MRYRIMPPGGYTFWQIAARGTVVRWMVSVLMCGAIIAGWYFGVYKPLQLFCVPATPCVPESARIIADLADTAHDPLTPELTLCDCTTTTLSLLRLFEEASLTVQSYACQKPTTKNGVTIQHITCACTGTLASLALFLKLLAESPLLIATIETTIKQHHPSFTITVVCDCIVADQ